MGPTLYSIVLDVYDVGFRGNILDDEELIETLSSSKIMGTKIEEQVKQQEITAVQIAEVRQVYKLLAFDDTLSTISKIYIFKLYSI